MVHLLLALIYFGLYQPGPSRRPAGRRLALHVWTAGSPRFLRGVISMIIAFGTILSSLASDRLTRALGPGKVTAISVAATALALFGFSISRSFWLLCLWAIPYGLGAGSVDAALNNYVALHFESRHMSWLHCMWGLGATLGPYIMSYALTGPAGWPAGYRYVAYLQLALTLVLFLSLPLWRSKARQDAPAQAPAPALTLGQVLRIPGVKAVMAFFFCYCGLEQAAGLWASTYLTLHDGLSPQAAASYASMFFIGITLGRALSGFLTIRLRDPQMIRLGSWVIGVGILFFFLPGSSAMTLAGLILVGLGCAPIYPCIIHATPAYFGADRSQAIIGVQMASAYVGTLLMPPCSAC